jgi:NH3-dependent NAD+ synthetase
MIKNAQKLVDMVVNAMRKQAADAKTSKAEVDISGGIDSAVVAALACQAFDKENVIGVYSSIDSSYESHRRAKLVAGKFGFRLVELDLSGAYRAITAAVAIEFGRLGIPFPDPNDSRNHTVFGGLRSCLRAPVGRFVNRAFGGGIRQGTGNRDEDELIRFYQKGGDGEVDNNWIEGLFKGEVWELAAHLGVPQEIIDANPTPDLWGGAQHTDEDELKELTGVALTYTRPGGPMGTIEWASRENAVNGCVTSSEALPSCLGYANAQAVIILALRRLEKASRHKACMPPLIPREELVKAGAVE